MQEIGIITPYKAQKLKLQYEKFSKFNDLKIESVDGFQGMEKDYIIISTVRSNTYGTIGFLRSQKRLNVSLTRARKGVIILGDAECLSKRNSIWRDLIEFYNKKKLIVEGDDLDNLDLMINNGRLFKEIDEEEEYIEEDDIEFDKSQMDQLLNVNKQTSLELIWGMSSSLAEEEEKEEEKEEEEGKNEIIGLDVKNKKKKNKNKNLEGKEKEQDIKDEKEEKNKKNEEESDSDENNRRKKKKKKKGKK